ncbi:MAG: TIGR04211 family SH3 domain-containing protein [Thermodesulfovibrionales bacterium]|nr:TIGR04211 family SH3 domain-containing protein [Thermodesulfovibrionales bacterium]
MRTATCILTIIVLTAALALPAFCETNYIIDRIVVGLRNSPDKNSSLIRYISTGEKLDVLSEEGEHLFVRTSDGKEGWVKSKYATKEMPGRAMADNLGKKITRLEVRLKQVETSRDEMTGLLHEARAEAEGFKESLTEARKQYNDLAEMSDHVQSIAAERDMLKGQVRKLRDEGGVFLQLRNTLANRDFLLWFLGGGGVFLVGWLTGKSSKKERYY